MNIITKIVVCILLLFVLSSCSSLTIETSSYSLTYTRLGTIELSGLNVEKTQHDFSVGIVTAKTADNVPEIVATTVDAIVEKLGL